MKQFDWGCCPCDFALLFFCLTIVTDTFLCLLRLISFSSTPLHIFLFMSKKRIKQTEASFPPFLPLQQGTATAVSDIISKLRKAVATSELKYWSRLD